jgi:hypothetical protein
MTLRLILVALISMTSFAAQAGQCVAFETSATNPGLREQLIVARDLVIGPRDGSRKFASNDNRLILAITRVSVESRSDGRTTVSLSASLTLDGRLLLKTDGGSIGTFGSFESSAYLADGTAYGIQCQALQGN